MLVIPGSGLTAPITNGPEVCIADSNGQPDSQMCYQPASQSASLNITPGAAAVLGQSLGGGTVACLGGAPYLNLIAATADNSSAIQWSSVASDVPNAESSDDGATNTANIVATLSPAQDINSYAAGVCSEYAGGGYTDWFLPAQNQLACLCANKGVVGGFAPARYWGSTELDPLNAEDLNFFSCSQVSATKLSPRRIRCVRALTL